jgi:hypothetical protein
MKRFHVHVSVEKLDDSIRFYSMIRPKARRAFSLSVLYMLW